MPSTSELGTTGSLRLWFNYMGTDIWDKDKMVDSVFHALLYLLERSPDSMRVPVLKEAYSRYLLFTFPRYKMPSPLRDCNS